MQERKTQSEQDPSNPLKAEQFPDGFLLFDEQVKTHKEYLTIIKTHPIQNLVSRIELLSRSTQSIPEQAILKDQIFQAQEVTLNSELANARRKARNTKKFALESTSVRAKLYRAINFFSWKLAEKIVPVKRTLRNADKINNKRSEIINGRKRERQDDAHTQIELTLQRQALRSELDSVVNSWLFENPQRALLYALTNLNNDKNGREAYLLQYAKHAGMDIDDLRKTYHALEAKAFPSRYAQHLEPLVKQAYDQQINPQSADNFMSAVFTRPNIEFRIPAKTEENETTPQIRKRRVLLHISKNVSVSLSDIAEEEFKNIVKKSNASLSYDQIVSFIDYLSSTQNPLEVYQRYPHTVKEASQYNGYHVAKRGRMGRFLFKYSDNYLNVRFGHYFDVYGQTFKSG